LAAAVHCSSSSSASIRGIIWVRRLVAAGWC
jgi:hypothetical protein